MSNKILLRLIVTSFLLCIIIIPQISLIIYSKAEIDDQNLNWSPEICIGEGGRLPETANYGNNIHIIWSCGVELKYSRSDDDGKTWQKEKIIDSNSIEGEIAVYKEEVYIIVSKVSTLSLYHSENGGDVFKPEKIIPINSGIMYYKFDPSLFIFNNTLHLTWINTIGNSNNEIWYIQSNDKGETWSEPLRLTYNIVDAWGVKITANEKFVHIVWDEMRTLGRYLCYTRSINNGVEWENTQIISDMFEFSSYKSLYYINRSLHIIWYYQYNYEQRGELYYRKSINNGETWEGTFEFTEKDSSSSYYPIVKGTSEDIYVIWADQRGDNENNMEINFRVSKNNGDNWSSIFHITKSDGFESDHPALCISDTTIHTFWEDASSGDYDIFYSWSAIDFEESENEKNDDSPSKKKQENENEEVENNEEGHNNEQKEDPFKSDEREDPSFFIKPLSYIISPLIIIFIFIAIMVKSRYSKK
jgi:hypothetical protein